MNLTRAICTGGGIGLLKPAPGTWGSAAAVAAALVIHGLGSFPALLGATLVVTALGFWAVRAELRTSPDQDPPQFVIDEVAGQWIALLFPSCGFWLMGLSNWHFPYPGWIAAFVFFRLFDIWKPWIIGRADRRGDWIGLMADDLIAGIFAGLATLVAAAIAHGVFL